MSPPSSLGKAWLRLANLRPLGPLDLLGELPQFGLNAAVPHAHAGQRGANVPCGPWRETKSLLWQSATP